MVHVSHEIWGVGVVVLLMGILIIKALLRRRQAGRTHMDAQAADGTPTNSQDLEHRALMYLMAEKTDSLLGALAETIAQERQKLGGVVRNPSMEEALERLQVAPASVEGRPSSTYEAVLPMAQQGMDEAAIARQLRLPEDEVALVMRLKAA